MPRALIFAAGGAALLAVAVLVLTGAVPASATLDTVAPWVGFGGAFFLFILAIRSRRT